MTDVKLHDLKLKIICALQGSIFAGRMCLGGGGVTSLLALPNTHTFVYKDDIKYMWLPLQLGFHVPIVKLKPLERV